ncbi:iron-containing redox enzyme family protein [Pseudorhodoferax sp. Leaf267]|uniref:iron-containing redox enzyme family protein n=1 Tax=Pseudorhodoferax sp. Leaf267 TaxID=1736316 RepID=UPI0006F25A95|nr:iron-containing redox enzyme family protein [Pseudorhodoferax sp. Leaf267]KQP20070.1 hypothetical protein ASF43_28340 [Pseudorhodoferax sp. Leaf267]
MHTAHTSRPAPAPRQAYPCSDDHYPASIGATPAPDRPTSFRAAYDELVAPQAERQQASHRSLALVRRALEAVAGTADDLPASPDGLADWMAASAHRATDAYQAYLAERKAGAPRRFFTNRTHALHFLQAVAPTKLVDGAWLHGCLRYARDPRMAGLAQTYLEELGNGDETKNHVLLYRELLRSHGLSEGQHLADAYFEQGALQLALGHTTEQMLPEVIGFNLGYEQLPLHLLITAYELNELGLDPYYFTLHITVDNADSGHARKAVDAVALNAPRYPDAERYWQRVRRGYRLNDLGLGTNAVIGGFDIDAEVLRIFAAKSVAGAGAHSDYCRIEGRTVNEWLSDPALVGGFVQALVRKGWIVQGGDPAQSRFWQLLVGDRAEMFGVFSDYELQAIFDWMRGAASADGLKYDAPRVPAGARARSFRAEQRLRALRGERASLDAVPEPTVGQLAPGAHWTAEGLDATRQLVASMRAG